MCYIASLQYILIRKGTYLLFSGRNAFCKKYKLMCQIESPSDFEQTISGFWHYLNHINYRVINIAAKFVTFRNIIFCLISYILLDIPIIILLMCTRPNVFYILLLLFLSDNCYFPIKLYHNDTTLFIGFNAVVLRMV